MSLSKFNKNVGIDWGIKTDDLEFKKALDMKDGEYPFLGGWISPDNGYGEGAVIITDGYLVNAPSGFVDVLKEIRNDPEAVELVKEGNEIFCVEHYESKKYKEKVNGKMVPKQCVRVTLK